MRKELTAEEKKVRDDLFKHLFDNLRNNITCAIYAGLGLMIVQYRGVFAVSSSLPEVWFTRLGWSIVILSIPLLILNMIHGVTRIRPIGPFQASDWKDWIALVCIPVYMVAMLIVFATFARWQIGQKITPNAAVEKSTPQAAPSQAAPPQAVRPGS